VARGTTGAPRNTPSGTIPASGLDGLSDAEGRGGRMAGIVCGRRTKYFVVAFWILVIAATGSFAGKLAGAALPQVFNGIDSTLLYATLTVAVVLLLLAYRSPVLWLPPIISAGVALTAAEAVSYWLTQHADLTVNGQSEGILVVLVTGASTDYALLLIARYREELRRHADRHAAMAVALRRAGPAIIASSLTMVAGMLCLLAVEPSDISGLGPVAAVGIAVGLAAMVTLLPALLVVSGRWIFWPARTGDWPAHPGDWPAHPGDVRGEPGFGTEPAASLILHIGRHKRWPSSLARTRAEARSADRAA
jgi:hypothetical protein